MWYMYRFMKYSVRCILTLICEFTLMVDGHPHYWNEFTYVTLWLYCWPCPAVALFLWWHDFTRYTALISNNDKLLLRRPVIIRFTFGWILNMQLSPAATFWPAQRIFLSVSVCRSYSVSFSQPNRLVRVSICLTPDSKKQLFSQLSCHI